MDENKIDENYVQVVSRLYKHFMGEIERRGRIDIRSGLFEFLICEFKNGQITQETLFKAQEDLAWLMRDDDNILEGNESETLEKEAKVSSSEERRQKFIQKLNSREEERKNSSKSTAPERKIDIDYMKKIMPKRKQGRYAVDLTYSAETQRKAQIFDLKGGKKKLKDEKGSEGLEDEEEIASQMHLKTEFATPIGEKSKKRTAQPGRNSYIKKKRNTKSGEER